MGFILKVGLKIADIIFQKSYRKQIWAGGNNRSFVQLRIDFGDKKEDKAEGDKAEDEQPLVENEEGKEGDGHCVCAPHQGPSGHHV